VYAFRMQGSVSLSSLKEWKRIIDPSKKSGHKDLEKDPYPLVHIGDTYEDSIKTCLATWRSHCGTFHGDMVISHVETIMETSLVILIEIFCWRHWRYGEKLFLLLKNPKKGDTIPRTCHNLIFTPFKNKNFIKILRKQNLIDFCKKRKEKIVA